MSEKPFHNPFGALGPLKEQLEREKPAALAPAAEPAPPATPSKAPKGPARAVVRLERAGRGGKDVTVIEQLGLSGTQLSNWLKDLKGALGCGGVVEDGSLVLQGDHRKRLPAILTERGVRKVTVG